MSSEEIIFLVVWYAIALAFGKLTAILWWWLRLPLMIAFPISAWNSLETPELNYSVILVIIIPIIIFEYPSIKKMLNIQGFPNPFSFISEMISQKRYMHYRLKEMEFEKERYARAENITRMQTEEAERQRQYERERERANRQERKTYDRQDEPREEKSTKNEKSDERFNDRDLTLEKAYNILGVTKDMSKQEIRKAYLKLMSENAPDKVSHMSKAFQDLAHERCIQFNLAWEKITKG